MNYKTNKNQFGLGSKYKVCIPPLPRNNSFSKLALASNICMAYNCFCDVDSQFKM